MSTPWPDGRVARLRKLWLEHPEMTLRDIGESLGLSHGALMGKAFRLGLPPRRGFAALDAARRLARERAAALAKLATAPPRFETVQFPGQCTEPGCAGTALRPHAYCWWHRPARKVQSA